MVSVIVPSLHSELYSKPIRGFTSLTKQYQVCIFLFISYLYPLCLCFPGQCLHKEPQWKKNEPVEALYICISHWLRTVGISSTGIVLRKDSLAASVNRRWPVTVSVHICLVSIGQKMFSGQFLQVCYGTIFPVSWIRERACVCACVWQLVLFTTGRHFPRVAFLLCIKQSQLEYNHKSHMLSLTVIVLRNDHLK